MSKTTFPDVIGPSSVSANGGTAVGIRKRVLNIVSAGIIAADNQPRRRTDVTLPDPTWVVVTANASLSGEWLPLLSGFAGADVVRVTSPTTGTVLTGLDSGATDPTHLVKFVANFGSNSISIAPPASPIAGKQYYTGNAYTLAVGHTVRMTWDTVTRVYRIRGTAVSNYIIRDSIRLVIDGNPILNPE